MEEDEEDYTDEEEKGARAERSSGKFGGETQGWSMCFYGAFAVLTERFVFLLLYMFVGLVYNYFLVASWHLVRFS